MADRKERGSRLRAPAFITAHQGRISSVTRDHKGSREMREKRGERRSQVEDQLLLMIFFFDSLDQLVAHQTVFLSHPREGHSSESQKRGAVLMFRSCFVRSKSHAESRWQKDREAGCTLESSCKEGKVKKELAGTLSS